MKYSKDVEKAIKESKNIALEFNSKTIKPEHLFLSFIRDNESDVYNILRDMNLNIDAIKSTLKDWSIAMQNQMVLQTSVVKKGTIALDFETDRILKNSVAFATEMDASEVESQHVFYSMLENTNNLVTELFSKSKETLKNLKARLKGEIEIEDVNGDYDMEEGTSKDKVNKNSKTKLIDQFGTDLTKLAKEGLLDPVVGRKNEIKRITQILARRKKNNPVLVGEPGVGKSAIVEGIAQRIVSGDVPENLKDKKNHNS